MTFPSSRRWAALLALGVVLAFWACHTEPEPGKTYMDVAVDPSWVGTDTVRVVLMDLNGNPLDTLFEGVPGSVAVFKKLEVKDYHGETIRITLQQIRNGKVVRQESRDYNGQIGSILDRDTLVIAPDTTKPDTTKPQPDKPGFDIKPDRVTLYLGGAKERLSALPDSAWKDKPITWTSLKEEVATVSSTGELTAVAEGEARVMGEGAGGYKDTATVTVLRDVPELDVGAPDTAILTKTTLAFKVRATQAYGTIACFAWDLDGDNVFEDSGTGFPAGRTEFSTTPRSYPAVADIRLHFYIRDGEGNVDTASKRLRVTEVVPVIDSITASKVISIKDSVQFAAKVSVSSRTLAAYAWDYDGDGKTDDSASLAKASESIQGGHRYNKPDVFNARLKVYDAAGTVQTGTVKVTVLLDAPRADAGPDFTVDVSGTINLKGTDFDSLGSIAAREWKVGTAAFVAGDGDTSFTAPSAAGSISCLFRATDDDGVSDTDTVVVTVVLKQAPALTWSQNDTVISIKDNVAFLVKAAARGAALKGYAWDWDGNGTADSSGTLSGRSADITATRNFPTVGVFIVKLTVTDQDNLPASAQKQVTVKAYAPMVSAGADTTVTVGTTINLHGSEHDSVGTIAKREWKIGAGAYTSVGKGDTSFAAPAAAGSLPCRYRVTDDDGNVIEDEVVVTVALYANADLSLLQVTPTTAPVTIPLDSAVTGSRLSYHASPVANSITALRVRPGAAADGASITVNGNIIDLVTGAVTVALVVGANPVDIVVTAPDGVTKKAYKLTLYRAAGMSMYFSSATLSTLADTGVNFQSSYNPWHTVAPTISHTSRGKYTISFTGLGGAVNEHRGGNVLVGAYGDYDTAYCKASSFVATKQSGFTVNVSCYTYDGKLDNAWPTVFAQHGRAAETGANAYFRVNLPTKTGTYDADPEFAFNSASKPILITRTGTGAYTIQVKGIVPSATVFGSMAVTAVGTGSERCNIVSYAPSGSDVVGKVQCNTAAGDPADAGFTGGVIFPLTGNGIPGLVQGNHRFGYGLFDIFASETSLPNSPLIHNPGTSASVSTYYGTVGRYSVDFDKLEDMSAPMAITGFASSYGVTNGTYCTMRHAILYIGTNSTAVTCYDRTGQPAAAKFMVWMLR